MNELYIGVIVGLAILTVVRWGVAEEVDGWVFVGSAIVVIMALGSVALPFGGSESEIRDAINIQVGNELIIQADGWPTQIEDSIKFVDQKVVVRKTTLRNAWGGALGRYFSVELDETVEKEKDEQN